MNSGEMLVTRDFCYARNGNDEKNDGATNGF